MSKHTLLNSTPVQTACSISMANILLSDRHITKPRMCVMLGLPGSGKTIMLKLMVSQMIENNTFHPTNIFAIGRTHPTVNNLRELSGLLPQDNLHTFHKLMCYPFKNPTSAVRENTTFLPIHVWHKIKLLLIDEYTQMKSTEVLFLDLILRMLNVYNVPFGGITVLFVGDNNQNASFDLDDVRTTDGFALEHGIKIIDQISRILMKLPGVKKEEILARRAYTLNYYRLFLTKIIAFNRTSCELKPPTDLVKNLNISPLKLSSLPDAVDYAKIYPRSLLSNTGDKALGEYYQRFQHRMPNLVRDLKIEKPASGIVNSDEESETKIDVNEELTFLREFNKGQYTPVNSPTSLLSEEDSRTLESLNRSQIVQAYLKQSELRMNYHEYVASRCSFVFVSSSKRINPTSDPENLLWALFLLNVGKNKFGPSKYIPFWKNLGKDAFLNVASRMCLSFKDMSTCYRLMTEKQSDHNLRKELGVMSYSNIFDNLSKNYTRLNIYKAFMIYHYIIHNKEAKCESAEYGLTQLSCYDKSQELGSLDGENFINALEQIERGEKGVMTTIENEASPDILYREQRFSGTFFTSATNKGVKETMNSVVALFEGSQTKKERKIIDYQLFPTYVSAFVDGKTWSSLDNYWLVANTLGLQNCKKVTLDVQYMNLRLRQCQKVTDWYKEFKKYIERTYSPMRGIVVYNKMSCRLTKNIVRNCGRLTKGTECSVVRIINNEKVEIYLPSLQRKTFLEYESEREGNVACKFLPLAEETASTIYSIQGRTISRDYTLFVDCKVDSNKPTTGPNYFVSLSRSNSKNIVLLNMSPSQLERVFDKINEFVVNDHDISMYLGNLGKGIREIIKSTKCCLRDDDNEKDGDEAGNNDPDEEVPILFQTHLQQFMSSDRRVSKEMEDLLLFKKLLVFNFSRTHQILIDDDWLDRVRKVESEHFMFSRAVLGVLGLEGTLSSGKYVFPSVKDGFDFLLEASRRNGDLFYVAYLYVMGAAAKELRLGNSNRRFDSRVLHIDNFKVIGNLHMLNAKPHFYANNIGTYLNHFNEMTDPFRTSFTYCCLESGSDICCAPATRPVVVGSTVSDIRTSTAATVAVEHLSGKGVVLAHGLGETRDFFWKDRDYVTQKIYELESKKVETKSCGNREANSLDANCLLSSSSDNGDNDDGAVCDNEVEYVYETFYHKFKGQNEEELRSALSKIRDNTLFQGLRIDGSNEWDVDMDDEKYENQREGKTVIEHELQQQLLETKKRKVNNDDDGHTSDNNNNNNILKDLVSFGDDEEVEEINSLTDVINSAIGFPTIKGSRCEMSASKNFDDKDEKFLNTLAEKNNNGTEGGTGRKKKKRKMRTSSVSNDDDPLETIERKLEMYRSIQKSFENSYKAKRCFQVGLISVSCTKANIREYTPKLTKRYMKWSSFYFMQLCDVLAYYSPMAYYLATAVPHTNNHLYFNPIYRNIFHVLSPMGLRYIKKYLEKLPSSAKGYDVLYLIRTGFENVNNLPNLWSREGDNNMLAEYRRRLACSEYGSLIEFDIKKFNIIKNKNIDKKREGGRFTPMTVQAVSEYLDNGGGDNFFEEGERIYNTARCLSLVLSFENIFDHCETLTLSDILLKDLCENKKF